VFVQLESFVDVNYLKDIKFSENPLPTFTALKSKYTSGLLTVPSIGAGTANTEFEGLTGMRVTDFGAGEYPYKSILLKSTCESMAYIYKDYGYYTHAIHNNTGSFYDRNLVFPNLGIDRYNSVEYMDNVEYNHVGWAKDKVLVSAIMNALELTEQKDYIHAISVQGHGRYPSEKIDETQKIYITEESLALYEQLYGDEYSYVNEMEYFVNQLYEMDLFIAELVETLEQYNEKVVVVFYGDHYPSLNIENSDLDGCNVYQTEYVMWSNYDVKEDDKDLTSYQLGAYVSYQLGVNKGIVNRIHQKNFKKPFEEYSDYLVAVEYDMLYGEDYVNHGKELYDPVDMKMGLYDMTISEVIYDAENGMITVLGANFHENSMIFVNGKHKDTELISDGELCAKGKLKEGDVVCVVQMSSKWMIKLSYSNEITYSELTEVSE
jgi:hypothetical protein